MTNMISGAILFVLLIISSASVKSSTFEFLLFNIMIITLVSTVYALLEGALPTV